MIDSARTSPTLMGEQQLPPHRLQDSGLQASAMLHVVQSDNAAENPRPQRGVADWFRPKPQRYLLTAHRPLTIGEAIALAYEAYATAKAAARQ